jgi:integrase
MPKLSPDTVPSYRLHRQSGQAIVTLNGRDILLGTHNSAASRAEYNRRISEWLANNRQLPRVQKDMTVAELIAAYRSHVEAYYRHPDGKPTGESDTIRYALRPLRKMYGTTPAAAFSPLKLKSVREAMIDPSRLDPKDNREGWCRNVVNDQVARIRSMFKWAVSDELLEPSVYHGLAAVTGLKRGRSDARETEPVRPVPEPYVEAILPYCSPQVKAMIQLQLLTGARPGEIVQMRTGDIDTSGKTWVYRPSHHKTQHHGFAREIGIGPRAREILETMLKPDLTAFIFSPADAERSRREAMSLARKTPLSYGNKPGSNRKRSPKWKAGDQYGVDTYRRAIKRACDKAFPPPACLDAEAVKTWQREHRWHPHRLRHNAATRLRREHGIEMARIILGHRHLQVTELYAETDLAKARQVLEQMG